MSQSDPNNASRFLIAGSQGPRSEQQDSGVCLYDDSQGTALVVVGDGVGGRSGGRIASQTAIQQASELWKERNGRFAKPEADLAALCRGAHERINSEGSRLHLSPRTTIIALYLTPTQAWWVHSGDSRLYRFCAGQLVERTEDHSLLEMMVQRGAVKEEDMGSHPDQNTLLQSLGGEQYMSPSEGMAQITPDDGFLLCTDGFWERTSPEEMAALVFAGRDKAATLLTQAVERAVERNGPKGDNVTVALALPARG
jgi:serine/threonine protein phosphatase PrpC